MTAAGVQPTIGFTGHVNDADTGLINMQQRYYDPVAGRFLSVDPVVTDANTGGSFNRYNYAKNSPYKYIDPDGRDPMTWVHGGLTAASFCPSLCGSFFAATEGIVYLAQGEFANAGISIVSAAAGTVTDTGAVKLCSMALKEGAVAAKDASGASSAVQAVKLEKTLASEA